MESRTLDQVYEIKDLNSMTLNKIHSIKDME